MPNTLEVQEDARQRIAFQELLLLQLCILIKREVNRSVHLPQKYNLKGGMQQECFVGFIGISSAYRTYSVPMIRRIYLGGHFLEGEAHGNQGIGGHIG